MEQDVEPDFLAGKHAVRTELRQGTERICERAEAETVSYIRSTFPAP